MFILSHFLFLVMTSSPNHQIALQETLTSTLESYGSPLVGGYSAMATLVGVPCGIAVQLVLDGVLKTPGVHAPYTKEICDPLRVALEAEGITMTERVL